MWCCACIITAFFAFAHAGSIDDISKSTGSLLNMFDFASNRRCLDDCATQLMIAMHDVVAYGETHTTFADLCNIYSESTKCIKKHSKCEVDRGSFYVITSGVKYGCDYERQYFDILIECVERYTYTPLSECERACHFYDSLTNWTSNSRVVQLAEEGRSVLRSLEFAADFCDSFACYLSCSFEHLTTRCGSGAAMLIELFTRPLMMLASRYADSNSHIKNFVHSIFIPSECAKISYAEGPGMPADDRIDFSEGVLRNVSSYFGANTLFIGDYDPDSVSPFDQSLMKFRREDRLVNGLGEDGLVSTPIFTLVFIFLVLIGTVAALVIVVVWCCYDSKDLVLCEEVREKELGTLERVQLKSQLKHHISGSNLTDSFSTPKTPKMKTPKKSPKESRTGESYQHLE